MLCMQREPNPGAHRYSGKASGLQLIQTGHVTADCGRDLNCRRAFPTPYLLLRHECFHLVHIFVLVLHGQKRLPWWCRDTLLTYSSTMQKHTQRGICACPWESTPSLWLILLF